MGAVNIVIFRPKKNYLEYDRAVNKLFSDAKKHAPLGDHEEVGVIDLGMGKVSVLGKTSILNFLGEERERNMSIYTRTKNNYYCPDVYVQKHHLNECILFSNKHGPLQNK